MKAAYQIELFGEDTRALFKFYTSLTDEVAPGLGESVFGTLPPSGWVAEITGFDPKYKYQRQFLKPKKDYSKANAKGSRGVFAEYILESGRIYDIKSQITWKRVERFYCTVTDDGEIKKLTEEEVIECLKSRSE